MMNPICGIYKITNPIGSVYIGLSTNIKKRFSVYRGARCHGQKSILESLIKHGVNNHVFEIVNEQPPDVDFEYLKIIEKFYISQLKEAGCSMLNRTPGGDYCASIGKKFTAEHKKKIGDALRGRTRPSHIGVSVSVANKGRKHTKEARCKMAASRTGKKRNPESTRKSIETRKRNGIKVIFSEERKDNASKRMKANNPFKGKKHTDESKIKISKKNLGKTMSHESKKKISDAMKKRVLTQSHKNNIRKSLLGKKHSPERCKNISIAKRKSFEMLKNMNNEGLVL